MTASLNQLTAIATALNAAGKEVTVKTLPSRGPRKGETFGVRGSQSHGTSATVHSVRTGDGDHTLSTKGRAQGAGDCTVGCGITLNKVGGIGKEMVKDLDSVKRRAASTYAADRRAAARERMEEKLDALLATV